MRMGLLGYSGLGVIAFGLLLVWIGSVAEGRNDALDEQGAPAVAVVTGKEIKTFYNRHRSAEHEPKETISYRLNMEFETEAGAVQDVSAEVPIETYEATAPGDAYEIIYLPDDPHVFAWAGVERSRGPGRAALWVGGIVIVIGAAMIAFAQRVRSNW